MSESKHRVAIVGGGFGGLLAARALGRARGVEVTLIDRRNHHLFQPLLYQVATGGLSPANIAAPLRALVKKQRNTRVLLAEVEGFDLDAREVLLAGDGDDRGTGDETRLPYDDLIVATGAGQSYFGHDEWAEHAPGLKSIEDATRIRRMVLLAFERAERETDPQRRRALLTFVVVGGGPTGVELAGAIAEIAFRTLPGELRQVDPAATRIVLVEAVDRILPPFAPKLSAAAQRGLEKLGVEVRTGWMVADIEDGAVRLRRAGDGGDSSDGGETIPTETVLWAAGVAASPLGAVLAAQSRAELDNSGRVVVEADCSLAGRPEVMVIGDLARFEHGTERPLPGLAPVAMQQGRYAAKRILRRRAGKDIEPFRYVDKGNMATVGRKMAVAEIGPLRFSGLVAWLAWLFIHLMYLAEFENRVLVLIQWGWNYLTRNRAARLITHMPEPEPEDPRSERSQAAASP